MMRHGSGSNGRAGTATATGRLARRRGGSVRAGAPTGGTASGFDGTAGGIWAGVPIGTTVTVASAAGTWACTAGLGDTAGVSTGTIDPVVSPTCDASKILFGSSKQPTVNAAARLLPSTRSLG